VPRKGKVIVDAKAKVATSFYLPTVIEGKQMMNNVW
jgi:hypothetical protein